MKHLLKAKSEFRKKGIVLIADKAKSGNGGSWKFAGEDNLIKTIQEPLIECGLEILTLMDEESVKVILCHNETGEMIESKIKLPQITPRKDRNGNDMYLDAEIERGKQFGYWSRILTIRILGLSDIDAEDINNRPVDMSDDTVEMREELQRLIKSSTDEVKTKNWICNTYRVENVDALSSESLKHVINLLNQKGKKNANPKS